MRATCILLVCSVLSSGCATIFTGTSKKVTVTSTPSGQTFRLGSRTYTTPAKVKLSRFWGSDRDLTFGGQEHKVPRRFQPVSLVNLVWLGWMFIPWAVDAATGSLTTYPSKFHVDL